MHALHCNYAWASAYVTPYARKPEDETMAEKEHVWFGMKVTPEEKQKIKTLAERRGTTQKAVVLEAIERELTEEELPEAQPGSFLEATRDLAGSVEGPPDRLRDPNHMEGYGRW